MWKVKPSNENMILKIKVVVNKSQYRKKLSEGNAGEVKAGFIFKELVGVKDLGGVKYEAILDHITAEISKKPVLVAVTQGQLKSWHGKIIVAQLASFSWVGG